VIHNFGRNVAFEPAVVLTPQSEAEVLELLARHRGRNIRVVGRLHSWSAAPRGDEPWYAISLVSYARPSERAGFFAVAQAFTNVLAALCGGRPHWGKHCPLSAAQVVPLYPRRAEFQRIANQFDPAGQFRNRWLDDVLFGPTDD
jgi:FAD/FMN-containing dehydrogenase